MDLSLVLDQEGIPHQLRGAGEEQWALVIDDADAARAEAAVAAFERENPPPRLQERLRVPPSAAACGLVFFLSPLALHVWTGPDSAGSPFVARASADARA